MLVVDNEKVDAFVQKKKSKFVQYILDNYEK